MSRRGKQMSSLPRKVVDIVDSLHQAGGHCYLVGGYVRDLKLGVPSKDIDIEIHELTKKQVGDVLSAHGDVDAIGHSFGTYLIKGLDVDWTLPRTEKSIGNGHKAFDVTIDPFLGIEKALRRRDFTINAMAISLQNSLLIDPFRGDIDLDSRILRHVDEDTFVEDPLRVLRGAQFCARFGLWPDAKTVDICQRMAPLYSSLARERVWAELEKLLLKGIRPSRGIDFLASVGWLKFWPEIDCLFKVEQDPRHHPEGSVGIHTMQTINAAANLKDDLPEEEQLPYMLACLLHDVGKAETTITQEDGTITSHGHDKAGVLIARRFLERVTNEEDLIQQVLPLIENHMFPQFCMPAGASAFRRLQKKVDPYLLGSVALADGMREECETHYYSMLKQVGQVNSDKSRKKVVQGRDLIQRGLTPGPLFTKIISACEERFLETGERNPSTLLDQILPLF